MIPEYFHKIPINFQRENIRNYELIAKEVWGTTKEKYLKRGTAKKKLLL